MYRSLIHYGRINLAVIASAAVVTAVLSGALLVGDSLRGSLRDLALERLGLIDQALVAGRFFRADLATEVGAVPLILLSGSAAHGATGARASALQVHGVSDAFSALFPPAGVDLIAKLDVSDYDFPPVVVNAAVQRELSARVGDEILLSVRRPTAINRAYVLGSRESSALSTTLRVTVAGIVPDQGVGRFGLLPHQLLPRNAFVPIAELQRALDQSGRVNALLLAQDRGRGPVRDGDLTDANADLRQSLSIADLGLQLTSDGGVTVLTTDEFVLRPAYVAAAAGAAAQADVRHQPVLTYLANDIAIGKRSTPYSIVAAVDPVESLGTLALVDGSEPLPLQADDLLLNSWAAADLNAEVGDAVELSYYAVGPRENLTTRSATFTLRGIVSMQGLAVDPSLTPAFPGMDQVADMAAWDPPLPIDFSRIRPRDEAYWDRYGAAPKAFVSYAAGARLWSTRFGSATSVRIADPDGKSTSVARRLLQVRGSGMEFQPVRDRAVEAASGATDFGPLFIGFSLFLIAAAALLTAQLFRLGVEQRVREVGVLLALGHTVASVRARLVGEGLILAGVGGIVGTAAGLLYAAAMLQGLSSWWLAAVGTRFLELHVEPTTVLTGYVLSLLLVAFVIRAAVQRTADRPLQQLLGRVAPAAGHRPAQSGPRIAVAAVSLAMGGITMVLALWQPASAVGLFFATGSLWLVGTLAAYSVWLRRRRRHRLTGSLVLGMHNSSRHPGRSMMSAGLVACACFVIVAVGAHRRQEAEADGWQPRASGAGGFSLIADADVPLHGDLNSPQVRFDLGFGRADAEAMEAAEVFPMRLLPGEDVSCLNLYQPRQPRLLGVPDEFVERGGFTFQQHAGVAESSTTNPWRLLQQPAEEGTIPAIGDYNSVRWIMHLQLGDELEMEDDRARPVRLRLVGLLQNSLFQSELLISEANMLRYFPHVAGYRRFLIDTGPTPGVSVAARLEKVLGRFGVDVTSTVVVLEGFRAIENTYLSTFQTLGGLGLLLGTVGLGFIVLRHVTERAGELATLRACGFRRRTLGVMLMAENGVVLACGMAIGAGAALVAVAPHVVSQSQALPWWSLGQTLLAVLAVGTMATAAAAAWALRQPLIPSLRSG